MYVLEKMTTISASDTIIQMIHSKEYYAFRRAYLIALRKNKKNKYIPIRILNIYILRKWIKTKANEEYSKYVIENDNKQSKVSFSENNNILKFDNELAPNQLMYVNE